MLLAHHARLDQRTGQHVVHLAEKGHGLLGL